MALNLDRKKVVTICLIFLAFLVYVSASRISEVVFDLANWPVTRQYYLTIPEFVGLFLGVLTLVFSVRYAPAVLFFEDVAGELVKVTYPKPKESVQVAQAVVVIVLIATVLFAFYDSLWSYVTQWILAG